MGHAVHARVSRGGQVSDSNPDRSPLNFKKYILIVYLFSNSRLDDSVRVSNELGAGHPRVAKLSVFVVSGTSILISIVFSTIILIFKVDLSKLFSTDSEVIEAVTNLTPLLAISVFLNGIQPILSGKL